MKLTLYDYDSQFRPSLLSFLLRLILFLYDFLHLLKSLPEVLVLAWVKSPSAAPVKRLFELTLLVNLDSATVDAYCSVPFNKGRDLSL